MCQRYASVSTAAAAPPFPLLRLTLRLGAHACSRNKRDMHVALPPLVTACSSRNMTSTSFGASELDQFLADAELRVRLMERRLRKLAAWQKRLQRRNDGDSVRRLRQAAGQRLAAAYVMQALFSLLLMLEGEDPEVHVVKRGMKRCCDWANVLELDASPDDSQPVPTADASASEAAVS
jgi:hypothetical protein